MVSRPIDCDPNRLRRLLDDRLDDLDQAALGEHLEACDDCRRTLDALAAGSRWWSEARAFLGHDDDDARTSTHPSSRRDDPIEAVALDFLAPSSDPAHLGRLGPYEVVEVIGRGGMGVVLKALDPSLNRFVAIKVLAPHLATSATARRRFAREGRAAAAISHDHIVAIHAVDTSGGLPYLVMQHVAGKSLQERIDQTGPLAVEEIARIGMQAASGLAAAHAVGLIHRDIKPSNILLENCVERVKISDFGLARAVDDASLTQSGVVAGTPQYMSPEQTRGEPIDHRADLFSLGSVLYALCTGRPPFRADSTMAVLRRVSDDTPRPIRELNPEIPAWLAAIVAKLHAKDPAERFGTASEVADLFGRCLAYLREPNAGPPPFLAETAEPATSRRPRRRLALAGAAVALALCGLGAAEAAGVTDIATVLRIKRPGGTLVVKLTDPGVKVRLDDEDLVITDSAGQEVRVRPGVHKLEGVKDGKIVAEKLVTISRGGKETVEVGFEPEPRAGAALADTRPAERQWVADAFNLGVIRDLGAGEPGLTPADPGVADDTALVKLQDQVAATMAKYARARVLSETGDDPRTAQARSQVQTAQKYLAQAQAEAAARVEAERDEANRQTDRRRQATTPGMALAPLGVNSARGEGASRSDLAAAKAIVLRARDRIDWARQMFDKGYLAHSQLLSDQTSLKNAEDDLTAKLGARKAALAKPGAATLSIRDGRLHGPNPIPYPAPRSTPAGPDPFSTLFGTMIPHPVVPPGANSAPPVVPMTPIPSTAAGTPERGRWPGASVQASWPGTAVLALAIAPDGKTFATACADGVARVWDMASREVVRELRDTSVKTIEIAPGGVAPVPPPLWAVAYTPDGAFLIAAGGRFVDHDRPSAIRVWQIGTGKVVARLEGHLSTVLCLAVSPDGKRLVSGGFDRKIIIWELPSGRLLKSFEAHDDAVRSLAFRPDGGRFASASFHGAMSLWHLDGLKETTFKGTATGLNSVAFAPSGKAIAVGGNDAVDVWSWTEGENVKIDHKTLRFRKGDVLSVAFSADSQSVAAGGGRSDQFAELRIWTLADGKEVVSLVDDRGPWIECLAFTPDGKTLITGGGVENQSGCVTLWELNASRPDPPKASATPAVPSGIGIAY